MITQKTSKQLRISRKKRIRSKIKGIADKPRLVISKSNKALYAQLVNDEKNIVISGMKVIGKSKVSALKLSEKVINTAKKKKITTVVFDRGGFKFHGVVKAFADACRDGGIKI